MNSKTSLAAPCGIYCGDCDIRGDKCAGCIEVQGKPFWVEQYQMEVCPLYGCAVNEYNLEHCGECKDFPCPTFLTMRDPSMTDEQFESSINQRKSDLMRRKEIGTEAWLEERA